MKKIILISLPKKEITLLLEIYLVVYRNVKK